MLTKRSAAEPRPRFCLRLIDLQDQTKKQIKEVFYSIKQDYSPAFKSLGLGRACDWGWSACACTRLGLTPQGCENVTRGLVLPLPPFFIFALQGDEKCLRKEELMEKEEKRRAQRRVMYGVSQPY